MEARKTTFALHGSGWRSEFYLRIARALPDRFAVAGVVTRDAGKRAAIESNWNVPVFASATGLLAKSNPNFFVVAVNKNVAATVIAGLSGLGQAILAETPPATSLEDLRALFLRVGPAARIQVAEQFHLQPLHAAFLAVVSSGRLGPVDYVHASVNHGYHNVSLIRKALGIAFEDATISANRFSFPIVDGPGREGPPPAENIVSQEHLLGVLDFGAKAALFDFAANQHRSWARTQRFMARGPRGEISNLFVRYLKDFQSPVEFELRRVDAGDNGNLEGYFLKGILAGEDWIWRNPFAPASLSDEEIAIAECLVRMTNYVRNGMSFYSLAEAAQDQYLALCIESAAATGTRVRTVPQPWVGSP